MYVSDVELVERWLKDWDSDAFAEIVSRHAGMVHGTCTRILGDAVEAEDVAQDCFISLSEVRNLKGASLRGLLHQLATHRSLNRLRAQSRRRQREIAFAMSGERKVTPDWDDVRPCVDEAIAALPEKFRGPVIGRFLEGQTYEAMAQSLGVDESTVRYRVKKGIERVRRALRRRGISLGAVALAAMLEGQIAAAAALPAGLTAALGKLAVAGGPELAAGASTAGGALGASKLALIGGTVMWTKTLLVLGTVTVGLAAFYVVYSGGGPPLQSPETTPSPEQTAEDSLSLGETKNDVARIDGNTDESTLAAERMGIGAEELVRVLERLFASGSDDGQGADAHAPYTSKDIALDNGAHYFLLAVELFPDVDMQKLYAKWEELQANDFPDDPEFWAMLAKFQEAFEAIRTGLKVGNALMPPVRTPGSWPHLPVFRYLAQVMNMEARYYAAQGHYGASFDDYLTVLNFASESSRGGVVIDGLLAIAAEQMAAKSLRETLAWGGATPEDCRFLIDEMEALDAQMNTAWEILETEAGLVNSWLDVLLETGLDLRAAFEEEAPEFGDVLATMTNDELESMYRESFQDYDGLVEYLALPYYEAQAVDLDALLSQNPIGHLLVEAMGKILVQEAATRAEIRGTILAVALELYTLENGAYPDSLEALMPGYLALLPEDPFSGGSFGYAASGVGYVLWSAGPDMRDDGGVPLDGTGPFDEREGDIVIQGEEADAVG